MACSRYNIFKCILECKLDMNSLMNSNHLEITVCMLIALSYCCTTLSQMSIISHFLDFVDQMMISPQPLCL